MMIWIILLSTVIAFSLLTKDKNQWSILDKKNKKKNK